MFDLNDVWRAFKLDKKKQPNQWRHRIRRYYEVQGKMQALKASKGTQAQFTWATEEALYAYAMWVDVEFYMVVVEAFAALTENRPQSSLVSSFSDQFVLPCLKSVS